MRIILVKESTNEARKDWRRILIALVNAVNKQLADRDYYALFKPTTEEMRYTLNLPGSFAAFIIEYTAQENSITFWFGGDKVAAWSIDAVAKNKEAVVNEIINGIDATLQKTLSLLVGDAPPPPITTSSIVELLTSIFQLAEQGIKREFEKAATIFLSSRKISQQPNIHVEILPDWGTLRWNLSRNEFYSAQLSICFDVKIIDSVKEKAVIITGRPLTLFLAWSFIMLQHKIRVTPAYPGLEEISVSFDRPPLRKHIAEVIVKAVEMFYRESSHDAFIHLLDFTAFRYIIEDTIYKSLMDTLRSYIPFPERIIDRVHLSSNIVISTIGGIYLQIKLQLPRSDESLGIIIYLVTLENVYFYTNIHEATIKGAGVYAYFGDIRKHWGAPAEQLHRLTRSLYKRVGAIQLEEPVSMKDLPKVVRLGEILGKTVIRFISNYAPHFISNLAAVIKRSRAG